MNQHEMVEIESARGKVIDRLEIYDEPDFGREVLLRFTDGTELAVEIEVKSIVRAKRYRPGPGEMEVLDSYEEE